jgi:hypothetical protein
MHTPEALLDILERAHRNVLCHSQGQVVAMCGLPGEPCAGLDYPLG